MSSIDSVRIQRIVCIAPGDLARFLPDGTIEFQGRADRQLKIRGFRVEPAEIEALLEQHPGIESSAVVGQQAASGATQLVAYLVPCAADSVIDPGAHVPVSQRVRARLHVAGCLREPGKVATDAQRKKSIGVALPEPGREDRTSRPYAAPRSATESELAAIWSEVLGCPKLGVHDDFFRLGGHSLLAVRLMARVCESMQVDLPLQCLFEAPTVAELGESVDANSMDHEPGR